MSLDLNDSVGASIGLNSLPHSQNPVLNVQIMTVGASFGVFMYPRSKYVDSLCGFYENLPDFGAKIR